MTEEKLLTELYRNQNRMVGWLVVGFSFGFTLGWIAAWLLGELKK